MTKLGWFLSTRLSVYLLAEILYMFGGLLPLGWAVRLWQVCLSLNPHHRGAASRRALALAQRYDHQAAWEAFGHLLTQLKNRNSTSASDLYLTWTPGRLVRRWIAKPLGLAGSNQLEEAHDRRVISTYLQVARIQFERARSNHQLERAADALDVRRSLGETSVDLSWATADLAWQRGRVQEAVGEVRKLVTNKTFSSPLDPERWAKRLLDAGELELVATCLAYANEFLPESPTLWLIAANLERQRGAHDSAREAIERAFSLEPQNLETFLAWQSLVNDREIQPDEGPMDFDALEYLDLGSSATFGCRIDGADNNWVLFTLPPTARGILPTQFETPFDTVGHATVQIEAHRPHRIHGSPWPLVLVAIGPRGYRTRRLEIQVPDTSPGQVCVTVTEDHEIHEERDVLSPTMLQRLLVDKSQFAADSGVAWTHFVETGSALTMPAKAAESGDTGWTTLHQATKNHLVDELCRGNDLQPHLHAFNDPISPGFPYRLGSDGWRPSLEFLLSAPETRGPWASACPPPGHVGDELDRFRSIERSVALVEELAREGDPDYRAVVWRSGLLDFGKTRRDLAWSVVALRRAGLWADSDLPKPKSPRRAVVQPAFAAGLDQPFEPSAGGPILQLPIVSNLEGDYLMGSRRLARRAQASVDDLRNSDGHIRSGAHLFTLLTHDKFLNARAGRDEFRLDREYGDWRTLRQHLNAWQRAGATFVTAREGVRRVLDDLAWHPVPWLEDETFLPYQAGHQCVRYTIRWIGKGLTASSSLPQHVRVTTPPSLRPLLLGLEVRQAESRLQVRLESQNSGFWLRLEDLSEPITCWFRLEQPIGPTLQQARLVENGWEMTLAAPRPFRNARLLIPWELLPEAPNFDTSTCWSLADDEGSTYQCTSDADGALVFPLAFHQHADFSMRVRLSSTPDPQTFSRTGKRL